MNAQKLAMYVLCFVLASGVVNSIGLFDPVTAPNVTMPTADLANGITEIGEGDVSSSTDLSDAVEGVAMLKGVYSAVKTMFSVLTIPGWYLYDVGFPLSIAMAIQTIVTVVEIWGGIQFVSNRSLKGME